MTKKENLKNLKPYKPGKSEKDIKQLIDIMKDMCLYTRILGSY